MITSEPVDATTSPVAQTVGDNTKNDLGPVDMPDAASGDASCDIPTPNMLLATQILDVAEVNDGLGGKIVNLDGSDD